MAYLLVLTLLLGHVQVIQGQAPTSQRICPGTGALTIECLPTERIDVIHALFGREGGPGDDTCLGLGDIPVILQCGDTVNTLRRVKDMCQNKQQCSITVRTRSFGGSQCGDDHASYLLVVSTCQKQYVLPQLVGEDKPVFISCGSAQYIHITLAEYNHLSDRSGGCSHAPGDFNVNVKQVVMKECENLHECDFIAGNDFFGGDPCTGFDKQSWLQIECLDYTSTPQTVVEDRQIYFRCPVNQFIRIESASYGVQSPEISNCGIIEDSLARVQEKCDNVTTECGFIVNNTFFQGDPCPDGDTPMSLVVNSSCLSEDEEAPVLHCPENIIQETEVGTATGRVEWSTPSVTDNSNEELTASLSTLYGSGSQFSIGTHTVIYEATDSSSNTGNCTFTIEVKDKEKPVLTRCPAQYSLTTEHREPYGIGNFSEPTAEDNSGNFTLSGGNPGQLYPIGVSEILYVAADPSGNVGQCKVSVEVHDEEDPYLVAPSECPSDVEVYIQDSAADHGTARWTFPVFADNSGEEPTVSPDRQPTDEYSYPVGTTEVTVRAQDASQNSFECQFSVFVHGYDATPPQLLPCPPHIETLMTDPSSDMASPIPFQITVNEPNGTRESSLSHNQPYAIGQNSVSLSAVNNAGVVGYCNFTVTVLDEEDPEIVNCPGNQTISTRDSSLFGYPTWPDVTVRDNSNDVTVSCSKQSGDAFDLGDITVVCTARDSSDNTNTCSFKITVIDENECSTSSALDDCAVQGLHCFNQIGGYSCDCPVGFCKDPGSSCLKGKLFVVGFNIAEMGGSEAVFTNDLNQTQSHGFLSLQEHVENLLDIVYREMSGFCRSSVSGFSSGSIVVTALVSVSESSSATLADVTQHLTDAINSESFLLSSDLKINAQPSVVPGDIDVCYDGYCQNDGTCSTDSSTNLASCLCPAWFSGERCEEDQRGYRHLIIVASLLTFLVLIVALFACMAFRTAFIAKRRDVLHQDGREVVSRRPLYDFRHRPTPAISRNIIVNKAFQPSLSGFSSPYVVDGGEMELPKPKRRGLRDFYD